MVCTLSQVLTRALADVGEGRHVVVAADLQGTLPEDALPKANGTAADVALVLVRAITPHGEIDLPALPTAREIWAILPAEVEPSAFVEALRSAPTARVSRVYHPYGVADVGPHGLVLRKVVKGKSARDVAKAFGVPCCAGPDLAEWADPGRA